MAESDEETMAAELEAAIAVGIGDGESEDEFDWAPRTGILINRAGARIALAALRQVIASPAPEPIPGFVWRRAWTISPSTEPLGTGLTTEGV